MSKRDLFANLFSKQGLITIRLAEDLMQYRPGDQILGFQKYSKKYKVGVGTFNAALRQLNEAGVIKLNSRGSLGTYIEEIDYAGLWHFTIRDAIVGSMPIPYSHRLEGFATGLYEVFKKSAVPLILTFVRGSYNRLESLLYGRCDFIVLSKLSYISINNEDSKVSIVNGFGPDTWLTNHVIVLRDKSCSSIQPGMRIGVDRQSADHTILVERACSGKKVELINLGYMQIRSALSTGKIDGTVWNFDDFIGHPEQDFNIITGPETGFEDLHDDYSQAVIAVQKDRPGLMNFLASILDTEKIIATQREVEENNRLPNY